jgi:hypothetical protein
MDLPSVERPLMETSDDRKTRWAHQSLSDTPRCCELWGLSPGTPSTTLSGQDVSKESHVKRLILLVALVMAMAVLAPVAFADEPEADTDDVEMEEKEPSAAQLRKAEMIADYFVDLFGSDVLKEDTTKVIPMRMDEDGEFGHAIGWGVMFKVIQCSEGHLAVFEIARSEDGWAVGQLCKDYERDTGTPKSFGQLQKEHRPEKSQKPTPPGQEKKLAKAGG